ncbi:hypothetical protein QTP86_019217 [Hemibagrus guttatus]|nr:hypothetical protein QTP86_019217 [Hemibagrus guttatus]
MFYIKSILSSCITAWFGNCTVLDLKTVQRIVRTAEKIMGVSLPSITDIYTTCCIRKANRIVDDPSHTLYPPAVWKENELNKEQMKSQQRIQEKQKKVQELKKTVDIVKRNSQAAVDDNERIFNELISSMEKKRSEVTELIRAQEKADLSRAERLLNQLEQEIADLQRRVTELEQLSHTHDDIHFLQSFPSLCVSPGCDDSPSFTLNQHVSFNGVRESLSDLKKQVEQICEKKFNKIHPQAAAVQMILLEPKNTEDFMQYFCYLTLDPNTVHPRLILSEKNRVVTLSRIEQRYSDHPERFNSWPQVLCKESVSGRCYWEVEWSGDVSISVSYKEISRKGRAKNGPAPSYLKALITPRTAPYSNLLPPARLVPPSLNLRRRKCRKMAEISIPVDNFSVDQFSCPVCLDLLKDPVAIPCGHSYCKVCINGHWDQEDLKGVYSCPQCRETFTPRPVLRRNNMLAEVVEKLKKTELQAASPAHCYAGPRDVECDSCTGRKHKALRTCLVCLASYCEDHLQPHYQSPAFKKHKLVEACAELQEKICSEHDKLMEIYCRTDQSFICYLCMMNKHKGHNMAVAEVERNEKQNELKEEKKKSQWRIEEKLKKVQELKQTVDTIKIRSQEAVDDSEKIFTELISSMEKKRSEVTELIRAQEKAEVSRAERLLNQLEQEIADLKRRLTELEQLLQIHDDIHFLQSIQSLCVSRGCDDSPSFTLNQHLSFDGTRLFLSDLKKRVEEVYQEEINKIVLNDFCYLTLDSNTVHRKLILSEMNRVVTHTKTKQQYSDHPERFDCRPQVLCKESVSGRCYWEVEWSGTVYISVSYKEMSRKGEDIECLFGRNSQSWSLQCSSSSVSFWHNNIKTELRGPESFRIGVCVDHSAGTLSFYSVSDMMSLLHRVHTTFTQPLYAGFCLWNFDATVRLCEPKLNECNVIESDED